MKGKLRIFFGYSAGIGKTYTMLEEAHVLLNEGHDVVLGYLEPHARPDTMKMAEGFEKLPLKEIEYKGIILKEFDVDKAIQRHPEYILVDELAHTNAFGSKNAKRYLDVLELLNSGINVYTTVNVQHLEGLNDVVKDKTKTTQQETVPDYIFDLADEISVIDLEPNDLIQRMKDGKIYNKTQANLALNNFFKTDNLSSLREIFLLRMAERLEKLKNNGNKLNKILVLISPSPSSAKNIRVASRMAMAYHTKFAALYVEVSKDLSDESARELKKHMQLVKDLGGDLIIKYDNDIVESIANYVRVAGVTNVIIGKTWQSIGKKITLENKIISRLPDIEVMIVPDKQSVKKPKISLFNLFGSKDLKDKLKNANRALDYFTVLSSELEGVKKEEALKKLAVILQRTAQRSVQIVFDDEIYLAKHNDEDITFFDDKHEFAVASWCKKNGKPAGCGTSTLREAKAIYLPIIIKNESIGAIGFSTQRGKMTITDRIFFTQIMPLTSMIISYIIKEE